MRVLTPGELVRLRALADPWGHRPLTIAAAVAADLLRCWNRWDAVTVDAGTGPAVPLAPLPRAPARDHAAAFAGALAELDGAARITIADGGGAPATVWGLLLHANRGIDATAYRTPAGGHTTAFLAALRVRLRAVLDDPGAALGDLPWLTAADERRLLRLGDGGPSAFAGPAPGVLHAIQDQVRARPGQTAATFGPASVTYGDLWAAGEELARRLRAAGVRPGDVVAVTPARSVDALVAVLGTLLAGAAYLPVGPDSPPVRAAAVLRDSAATAAVVARAVTPPPWLRDLAVVPLPPGPEPSGAGAGFAPPDAAGIAYVLSTSGTTGRPKSVPVSHAALAHMVREIGHAYRITADDRVLGLAPLAFDVSVFEMFATLCHGATLCLATEEERLDPDELTAMMASRRVTLAELPPALMPLLDPGELPDLRLVSVGGEAFPGQLVDRWRTARREFWNGYGPTETCVVVTLHRCAAGGDTMPPIGRPMPGYRAFVVDDRRRLVPAGAVGELCVSGVCLSSGYLGDPALTRERFVAAADGQGTMYRTGDLVRWLPGGVLEFLGRVDRQVKVSGHRVELGEIEAALLAHPGVTAAVAVAHTDPPGTHLLAFVAGSDVDGTALDRILAERLPRYARPRRVTRVVAMPLLPNGKIDTGALLRLSSA